MTAAHRRAIIVPLTSVALLAAWAFALQYAVQHVMLYDEFAQMRYECADGEVVAWQVEVSALGNLGWLRRLAAESCARGIVASGAMSWYGPREDLWGQAVGWLTGRAARLDR